MTKGFALDDERLKQGRTAFGRDYFRERLKRIRSIRASERRIWQQITDILPSAAWTMTETCARSWKPSEKCGPVAFPSGRN